MTAAGPAGADDSDPDGLLTLTVGDAANGGSCVARHDGRVVFVRHSLPGEVVRARVTDRRAGHWHADAVAVLEPSPDRVENACPIAGPDGAGCCDLSFATPAAARRIKGEVVANQLGRLGGYEWAGEAEEVGTAGPTGYRTRLRLEVGSDGEAAGRAGLHRYHSDELVTDLRCAQLADGLTDGLARGRWPPGAQLHVALDDDGMRHVVRSGPRGAPTAAVEGGYFATQRIARRTWGVPVTAFWQAHRDAAGRYAELIGELAGVAAGATAWDLYGGAGVFASVLAGLVGDTGRVLSVDTSRGAARSAREAMADQPWVSVRTESVRQFLGAGDRTADVAVLDPPRTGAGREVIDRLVAAGVPRVIHIGCEAASFARDVGLYRAGGYDVESLRVFDAFPLTHHVECVAVLTRR